MTDKKLDTAARMPERVCPICGRFYREHPALSRKDSTAEICPECGIREALESLGCDADDQEKILDTIHRHTSQHSEC